MPWSGSGVFTRVHGWVADRDAGYDILADRMDEDTDDIAQGLMHCLTVNGETAAAANLSMNNFRIINAASAVDGGDYVTLDQLNSGSGLAGLTLNGDLRFEIPQHPDKSIAYVTRHAQPPGLRRLGITASDPGAVYYPLEELWINAALITLTGTLELTSGDLIVAGNSHLSGTLAVAGAAMLSGNLSVLGDSNLSGSLVVGGGATIDGPLTAGSISAPGGYSGGQVISAGGLVGTSLQINGGATISGNLSVGGAFDAASLSSHGRLDVAGAAQVNGMFTAAGDLAAGGNAVVGNTLTVNNNAVVGNTLTVNNNRILSIGTNAPSVTCYNTLDGNAFGMWAASSALTLGEMDGTGGPTISILHLQPGVIWPNTDNGSNIGTPSLAWAQVFAHNYVTVSDAAVKTDIAAVPAGCLELVRVIEPKTYRLATAPAAEAARVHWGFVASDIAAVMSDAGITFGGYFESAKGRQGLAYDQLLAVLWRAVQELAAKVA